MLWRGTEGCWAVMPGLEVMILELEAFPMVVVVVIAGFMVEDGVSVREVREGDMAVASVTPVSRRVDRKGS